MKFLSILIICFSFSATSLASQSFEFAELTIPESGRIVVPVMQQDELSGIAKQVDEMTNGAVSAAMQDADFKGKKDTVVTLRGVAPFSRIDLVGIGKDKADRVAAENIGGLIASKHKKVSGEGISILWPADVAEDGVSAARVAFGYKLRSYTFDRHKTRDKDKKKPKPVITFLSNDNAADQYNNDLKYVAESVFYARDMSSEPANVIYPESFVAKAKELFKGVKNVNIKVLDEKDIQRMEMGSLWGVGKGSARPPRMLIIEYMAGGDEAPIVLAGKGITFDTGGISIKPNKNMWMMKGDLGGAAVVTGTVLAAAKRGAPINVVAIAALAENMPSERANRPGDLLKSMSGLTIEISSTDAEGRLVLADAVYYGESKYKPSVLIDVATLTGSVGRALGDTYAGIFGRHDEIIEELTDASKAAGEGVWRLPLDKSHFKQIKSTYGDVVNGGVGSPGASVGAAFIGSFISEDQVWAHFDIASVDYMQKDTPTIPKGYSGWGIRTLDEYLRRQQ